MGNIKSKKFLFFFILEFFIFLLLEFLVDWNKEIPLDISDKPNKETG